MAGAGWTDSKLKLTEIRLLDLVHDATRGGEVPPLFTYARDLVDDQEVLQAATDRLAAMDLIDPNAAASGMLSPFLTQAGNALVQERRELRSDPRKRAVACRDALLDWGYGADGRGIDDFTGDVRAHFEGDPFTKGEILSAARSLSERGYPSGAVIQPRLTAEGKTLSSGMVRRSAAMRIAPRPQQVRRP
jgi:hypothetical protein